MQNAKKWMLAILLATAFGSGMMMTNLSSSPTAIAQGPRPEGNHWRNFDGRWGYWHEGDKRWYYTDGTHWYYHNGISWVLYSFDRLFGATGFHHGEYRAPGPGMEIVVPRHGVHRY